MRPIVSLVISSLCPIRVVAGGCAPSLGAGCRGGPCGAGSDSSTSLQESSCCCWCGCASASSSWRMFAMSTCAQFQQQQAWRLLHSCCNALMVQQAAASTCRVLWCTWRLLLLQSPDRCYCTCACMQPIHLHKVQLPYPMASLRLHDYALLTLHTCSKGTPAPSARPLSSVMYSG